MQITQHKQCNEVDSNGKPLAASGSNIIVEPTKVFDNLYYIGGTKTGSWLFTTSKGHIMIDAMYGDSPETILIPGMKKLGLDPAQLKYILITHAGPDHAGGAKYFQENFNTRIVMSQQDWDGILNPAPGSWVLDKRPLEQRPPPERTWTGPPAMDLIASDGTQLTLGETTVDIFFTPRRATGGGLSFIVPVFDQGKPHMWGTYGNSGKPRSAADRELHRDSLASYIAHAEAAKVDVLLSSHPMVDGSTIRMQELTNRQPGEAHPFVIGIDGVKRYLNILDQCTALAMARNEVGLDDFGNLK